HPLLKGQLRYHAQLEHYKGLNVTTSGLATRHTQPDALEVERRSLQVYEQLEGSES
ncbi:IS21 family transposase, partial [Aneurinibacillus migulanus]|nr:IS21 family transposase [Aneurinibacillus migulanus]